MLTVKCIKKFTDIYDKVYKYRIQDDHGNTKDVSPEQLRTAMYNRQLVVTNLEVRPYGKIDEDPSITVQSDRAENQPKPRKFSLLKREMIQHVNKPKAIKFMSNQDLNKLANNASLMYQVYKLSKDIIIMESATEIIMASENTLALDNSYCGDFRGLFRKTKFTSIDLLDTDTSKVYNMAGMFEECDATVLKISNFDTSNVADMGDMFKGCKVKELDLSHFNTSKVKNMTGMFNNCAATVLKISNFDTSNVTNMSAMFNGCKVKELDISKFNTSNVTDMSAMFRRCETNSLDFSNFDTSNVTKMMSMFYECSVNSLNLTSFDTSKVRIMQWMFKDCKADFIDLTSFDTQGITNDEYISDILRGCTARIRVIDFKILTDISRYRNKN